MGQSAAGVRAVDNRGPLGALTGNSSGERVSAAALGRSDRATLPGVQCFGSTGTGCWDHTAA